MPSKCLRTLTNLLVNVHFSAQDCSVKPKLCKTRDNQNGGRLVFPDLQDMRLTVPENTTVNLRSTISQTGCSDQDVLLFVRKSSMTTPWCVIEYVNKSCNTKYSHCPCEAMTMTSLLIHTVTRSDTGPWTWKWSVVSRGETITETVYFNVIYPARAEHLILHQGAITVLQGPAKQNVSLRAICSVEIGNPPVEFYIIHETWNDRRESVRSSQPTTMITYTIPATDCSDMGFLHCRALGASENKTVPLLIRCPPMFNYTSVEHIFTGKNDLSFHTRSHTDDIQIASFIKTMADEDRLENTTAVSDARFSIAGVTGSPPDLTVSVRLENVRKQDQGTWRMTLTNDAGPGNIDVFLHVIDDIQKSTTLRSTADVNGTNAQEGYTLPVGITEHHPTESSLAGWMTACAAVVAASVTVFFVACWAYRKKQEGNKNRLLADRCDACSLHTQSNFGSRPDILASRRLARSEECVMIHNVLYQRSASLPEISEEDARFRELPKFDISNRPPALLPCDLYGEEEGEYAEVDKKAEEANDAECYADENDYVAIKAIMERKLAQNDDQPCEVADCTAD